MLSRAHRALTIAVVTLLFLVVSVGVALWARPAWVQRKLDLGLKLVGLQKYASDYNDMSCYVTVPMCYEMPAPEDSPADPGHGEAPEPGPDSLMVSVEARPSLTGIEVTCPSGFRTRSDIDPDGSALIGDVPAEPCVLRFLGETSARFSPVSAGQAVSCTVEGATATCEVVQEPEPEPEPDPSPEPS